MNRAVFIGLALIVLSGCATLDSVQPGAGGSTFHVQGKSYNQIWDAAVETAGASLTIVQSDKVSGTIKAEKEASLTSWGEVVGIFIRPANTVASDYTVQVESLKRDRAQITGENWEATMVAGIKARLGQ
jgi:hypothetical protein